jgi:hypothetical protein
VGGPIAWADTELTVLAVDAGRLAVRTGPGLRLLTAAGRVIRDIKVRPQAAALSGNRLVARTETDFEVYDTRTGRLTSWLPATAGLRLEDLERDILVTAAGGTVTLRRLGDGSTTTIRAGRPAFAQLEPSGLFVAGARRVTFIPMRDVLRRLGEGADNGTSDQGQTRLVWRLGLCRPSCLRRRRARARGGGVVRPPPARSFARPIT